MAYPAAPDVPQGNITVINQLSDHANPTRYLVINPDGSVEARLYVGTTAVPTPADAVAITALLPMLQMALTDATHASMIRVANVFKAFNAQSLTATASNTPVSIWTPAGGKKFRLLGYWFSLTTGAGIVFHDLASQGGTGVMPCPSPVLASAGIAQSPPMGLGILSAVANNQLWIDATTGTPACTGFVYGVEE